MVGKVLHLPMKWKWYDMIFSGDKKEEYRRCCEYWTKRIFDKDGNQKVRLVMFHRGYDGAKGDWMVFEVKSIDVGYGIAQWGATVGELCWVIKLGRMMSYQKNGEKWIRFD